MMKEWIWPIFWKKKFIKLYKSNEKMKNIFNWKENSKMSFCKECRQNMKHLQHCLILIMISGQNNKVSVFLLLYVKNSHKKFT